MFWYTCIFAQLFLADNSFTPLARYHCAKIGIVSRSRRAVLEILPAGAGVIDLIIVTFVGFIKQRLLIEGHASCSAWSVSRSASLTPTFGTSSEPPNRTANCEVHSLGSLQSGEVLVSAPNVTYHWISGLKPWRSIQPPLQKISLRKFSVQLKTMRFSYNWALKRNSFKSGNYIA